MTSLWCATTVILLSFRYMICEIQQVSPHESHLITSFIFSYFWPSTTIIFICISHFFIEFDMRVLKMLIKIDLFWCLDSISIRFCCKILYNNLWSERLLILCTISAMRIMLSHLVASPASYHLFLPSSNLISFHLISFLFFCIFFAYLGLNN